MSKKKAGGKTVQQKRVNPKYLGVKVSDGENVGIGDILIRQRGSTVKAGQGVIKAKDHTLFAINNGVVKFGKKLGRKIVSVISK